MIRFNESEKQKISTYLNTEAKEYLPALEGATQVISGFESPFGLELLSTVDWLVTNQGCERTVESIKEGIANWPAGAKWAQRKFNLFSNKDIEFALTNLEILA